MLKICALNESSSETDSDNEQVIIIIDTGNEMFDVFVV